MAMALAVPVDSMSAIDAGPAGLGPEMVLAALGPLHEAPMGGYVDVAQMALGLDTGARHDLDGDLAALLRAHDEAAALLHLRDDAPSASRALDAVADLEAGVRAMSDDVGVPDALDLMRAQPHAPKDAALWSRLASTTAQADGFLTSGSPLVAGADLLMVAGAPDDLDDEMTRLASIVTAHDAATAGAASELIALIDPLLSLQDTGSSSSRPVVPMPDDGFEAARALYAAYGIEPSPHEMRMLHRLRDLDAATDELLRRVAHAHLVQLVWTHEAVMRDPVDLALMADARRAATLSLAYAATLDAACQPGMTDNTSQVFSYDLSCAATRYDVDTRLVLDLGGDDAYHNNAGGTGWGVVGSDWVPSGMLFDRAGADAYNTSTEAGGGVVGGAVSGSALLFDAAGDDTYRAETGYDGDVLASMGGARSWGSPVDDQLCQTPACLYAGAPAVALLVDVSGDDSYVVDAAGYVAAMGGGGGWQQSAAGLLLDLDGTDAYHATLRKWTYSWGAEEFGDIASMGAALGPPPFSTLPGNAQNTRRVHGGLVDLGASTDLFVTRSEGDAAANGAALDAATGILLSGGGGDLYSADALRVLSANGAAAGAEAVGSLVDLGTEGDDRYEGHVTGCGGGAVGAMNAGAWWGGSALLFDEGGDDVYDGNATVPPGCPWMGRAAINGASSLPGLGYALWYGGVVVRDTLSEAGAGTDIEPIPFRDVGGTALLVDASGDDIYRATVMASRDQADMAANGAAYTGTAALLDLGIGNETYDAFVKAGIHDGGTIGSSFGAANGAAFTGYALLVDGGGDDTYRGRLLDGADLNATHQTPLTSGAVNGAAWREGTGLLLDAGGDDTYEGILGNGAINGAGAGDFLLDDTEPDLQDPVDLSLGILFDHGGDDSYFSRLASGAAAGAGQAGLGVLHDGAGADRYVSEGTITAALNGAAGFQGVGLLFDGMGDDEYVGRSHAFGALNGAADGYGLLTGLLPESVALLYDGGGADNYFAEIDPTDPDGVALQFVAGAMNGAGDTGSGLLVDAGGDDAYFARATGVLAAHGAAFVGSGVLADLGGNDTYNATVDVPSGSHGGLNGGAVVGLGLLLDAWGDDVYVGSLAPLANADIGLAFGGVNGGALVGVGALVDGAGANIFTAAMGEGRSGVGGSHGAGGGFLPDNVPEAVFQLIDSLPFELPNGVGILIGGTGDDVYTSAGTTQGAAEAYGFGLLLDPGGEDTYLAGPVALAQGAAENGGTGILADLAGGGTFTLLADSFGQGFAEQGAGLLVQLDPTGPANLQVDASATFATSAGAGVALRVALGFGASDVPTMACTSTQMALIGDPEDAAALYLCSPDRGEGVRIRDPATGEDMQDVPKPVVPCGSPPCSTIFNDAYPGGEADDWLERPYVTPTTSGQLQLAFSRAAVDGPGTLDGLFTFSMVDDWCDYSCAMMEGAQLGQVWL